MMKKERMTGLLLASAMILMSACGGQTTGGGGATTAAQQTAAQQTESTAAAGESAQTQAAQTETEPAGEPVTLTYWVPMSASAAQHIASYNENTAYQEAMKRLGIQIEFIHPAAGQETEEFNLLFLGDELPDIIAMAGSYVGGVFQGMRDGMYLDLTDLVPEYAPDYYKILTEDKEFYRETVDTEGHIVSFNAYKPVGDPPFNRFILNQDMLTELGCEIPQTVEDWENLFDKMLEKGITPYLLPSDGYAVQLMGMYDLYMNKGTRFYQDNGTIKFAPLEDRYLEYLTLLHDWYEKGYISKDFSSVTGTEAQTLFDTGKIGTYMDAIVASYNRGQAQGINVVAAPYPKLEAGQQLHWDDCNVWPRVTNAPETVVISKDCENVEAALKFLNYGYTQEGADLLNWGVEGINWDWQGDKRVYNDLMLNNPDFGTEEASYIYKAHFAPKIVYTDVECHANLLKSEGALNSRLQWSEEEYRGDSSLQIPPFQMEEDDQARVAELGTPLYTYVDEMTLKFITGVEDLSKFDEFRATIRSMGIEEILELEQKGYDNYLSIE